MRRALSFLNRLLFPPRCAGCGACLPLLDLGKNSLLCKPCKEAWERALRAQCPECHRDYPECTCMPHAMKAAGATRLVKLSAYGDGGQRHVVRHMILSMKKTVRPALCNFLAEHQAAAVLEALSHVGYQKEDAVILWLPRDRRAVRRYGTDQAKELAMALSRATGVVAEPILRRVKHTKKQKSLSEKERMQNLVRAFAIDGELRGRCAIVVDDIVTTGAGMSVAVRMLRAAGAKESFGVCVAVTEKKKGKAHELF